MNPTRAISLLIAFTPQFVLAGGDFRLKLEDTSLFDAWQLVRSSCPVEASSYKLRHPDRLITLSTEQVSCQEIVDILKKMDIAEGER